MDFPKLCTTRLIDQNFGMCISPQDILVPFFSNNATNYYRPWKLCEEIANKDFGSTIDHTNDKFKITLDVQQFSPNEVNVKVNDKEIIIEGKHEEKEDDHGFISRQFVRRYILPKDCLPESVSSTLSSDGVLSVIAYKKTSRQIIEEKTVPIQMAGLCRKIETTDKKYEMKNDKSAMEKAKCDMNKEQCEVKKGKCEIKKDIDQKKDKCEMKKDDKNRTETQLMLKEEHSRLLKPELLGEAVSGTEKLLSESRKETDELLRLMSTVQEMPYPTEEKLDQAIGQCKAAMKELTKDKAESNMSSIASSGMAMASSEMSASSLKAEMSSMKSSMTSEMIETSISKSTKSTSEKTSELSEIICAELKEAAKENT